LTKENIAKHPAEIYMDPWHFSENQIIILSPNLCWRSGNEDSCVLLPREMSLQQIVVSP
jgi:hypothetical protein